MSHRRASRCLAIFVHTGAIPEAENLGLISGRPLVPDDVFQAPSGDRSARHVIRQQILVSAVPLCVCVLAALLPGVDGYLAALSKHTLLSFALRSARPDSRAIREIFAALSAMVLH